MVRLIAYCEECPESESEFQFQYGTVDSLIFALQTDLFRKFQFQYGTVDRKTACAESLVQFLFQFQYGTVDRVKAPAIKVFL